MIGDASLNEYEVEELYEAIENTELLRSLILSLEKHPSIQLLNKLLHGAVRQQAFKSVSFLLRCGADINFNVNNVDGSSLLLEVCSEGWENMAQFLIGHGADVKITCSKRRNSAHVAYKLGHLKLGDWLIYKTDVPINAKDLSQKTPLDYRKEYISKFGKDTSTEAKTIHQEFPGTSNDREAVFVVNGQENDIACGSGFRGSRWLSSNGAFVKA